MAISTYHHKKVGFCAKSYLETNYSLEFYQTIWALVCKIFISSLLLLGWFTIMVPWIQKVSILHKMSLIRPYFFHLQNYMVSTVIWWHKLIICTHLGSEVINCRTQSCRFISDEACNRPASTADHDECYSSLPQTCFTIIWFMLHFIHSFSILICMSPW